MLKKSYAESIRETLASLPIKKRCCVHAFRDARTLFEEESDAQKRSENIRNYGEHVKCPSCMAHFVRALFLLRGSVTDPAKRYHLELTFDTDAECSAFAALLMEQGISGRTTVRKRQHIFYIKDGETIADFLAYIGANAAAFDLMNSRIEREFRSNVNRQVNCDTANIEKALQASERQIAVIRSMEAQGVIGRLPETLQKTAALRIQYDQMSLKELGEMHDPPITKSGVSHRLAKIVDAARSMGIEEYK